MKIFEKWCALLPIALGFMSQCFAVQANQPVECGRYYVQSGGVFIAPNAIYALVDEALVQINTLCADERGIFVPYEEIAARLVKCPFCQSWYNPDKGHECRGLPD